MKDRYSLSGSLKGKLFLIQGKKNLYIYLIYPFTRNKWVFRNRVFSYLTVVCAIPEAHRGSLFFLCSLPQYGFVCNDRTTSLRATNLESSG